MNLEIGKKYLLKNATFKNTVGDGVANLESSLASALKKELTLESLSKVGIFTKTSYSLSFKETFPYTFCVDENMIDDIFVRCSDYVQEEMEL